MIDYIDYSRVVAMEVAASEVTGLAGGILAAAPAMFMVQEYLRLAHTRGNRIFFIGNGGSAAIASHCAIDYLKNGRLRATALNDGAALTCISNDLGYDKVFSHQLEMHARLGDVLVAVSSSGESENILSAVQTMWDMHNIVVTLSGFKPDNRLRSKGHVNFYVPSDRYGIVEVVHLTILHAILDLMPLYSK